MKIRYKYIIYLIILILLIGSIYKRLSNYKINSNTLNNLLVEYTFKKKLFSKNISININPINVIKSDYLKYINVDNNKDSDEIEENNPIIYLYNSHQSEEYIYNSTINISPTVMINDYILKDYLEDNNYLVYVEERSVKDVLTNNNWKYSSSYKVTRGFLEEAKSTYPSLKYFIDIHRDSTDWDSTSIEIDNKKYAKILFIIGLENDNYLVNLNFTEKINNKLNEYYNGLSKGILKKEGVGVNGVYNQDFSGNTILIEIGGYQNTVTEVLNSTLAFGRCLLEIINE
jgi:stage II sporulation protein P